LLADLDPVQLELRVVLGRSQMPIHKLLRMGRGAVIELDTTETDTVEICANGHTFARGQVVVTGTKISVEVTELLKRPLVVNAQSLEDAIGA
jgi:flagellar motor switch protein FliN/FliY